MKDLIESLISQMIEHGIHYTDAVNEFEKQFIKRILDDAKGNQSRAAKALGIHRNTLGRKIEELDLDNHFGRRKRSRR